MVFRNENAQQEDMENDLCEARKFTRKHLNTAKQVVRSVRFSLILSLARDFLTNFACLIYVQETEEIQG